MRRLLTFVSTIRIDQLQLMALILGVLIQAILFLFNFSCSKWPMWISFGSFTVLLALQSRKRMFAFVGLAALTFCLTSYTFSYVGCDVIYYHFPMQDLLRNGWNPVYSATLDDFRKLLNGATVAEVHTLFLPRLSSLCGALVSLATGLYVADSYLGYTLLFVLFATSLDFARRVVGANGVLATLFSFSIVSTTKLTAILSGYVDYSVYASVLIMLFSFVLYRNDRRLSDIILMALAVVIAALLKTTGLVVVFLFALLSFPFLYKDRRYCAVCSFTIVLMVIIGYSPFVTSTIHFGSPLYPTMSFSAAHPAINITADFSGNDDALRMGYIARSCYAWVSPALATKLCALYYGKADFNPIFNVSGGVAGFGFVFRLLLCMSVIAIILTKKNIISLLCLFIIATTFVAPIKYIGFSRYFLQIWAVPPLAFLNFFVNHLWRRCDSIILRLIRYGTVLIPVGIASLCFLRTLVFYGRTISIERERQSVLTEISTISSDWMVSNKPFITYSLCRRMDVAGLRFHIATNDFVGVKDYPAVDYSEQFLWVSMENAENEAQRIDCEYPIADSVGAIVRFPWGKAFSALPSILRNNHEGTLEQ